MIIAFGLLIDGLGLLAEAWLIRHLWAWFAVPSLSAPPLATMQIAGLLVLVAALRYKAPSEEERKKTAAKAWTALVSTAFDRQLHSLLVIGMLVGEGWLIRAWVQP